MEDLAMDGAWDQGNLINDYPVEQDIKPDMSLVQAKKNEPNFADTTKSSSQQGGMLFMLFLVGAFVLSSRSTPARVRLLALIRLPRRGNFARRATNLRSTISFGASKLHRFLFTEDDTTLS